VSGKYVLDSGIVAIPFNKSDLVNNFLLIKYGKEKPPTLPRGISYITSIIVIVYLIDSLFFLDLKILERKHHKILA
jgi:hypothetical protein